MPARTSQRGWPEENPMLKTVLRILILAAVVCALLPAIQAQGTTGSILGTVFDQSKAVLPGVSITATEKDTGQKRTAVSDDQGRFAMAQMKVGTYTLVA